MYFFVRDGRISALPDVEGHPCGAIISMRVSEIPDFPEDGPIQASNVIEFDDQGEILATWSLPADYVLNGVRGDDLLIDIHGRDWHRVWIARDGSILGAAGIAREDHEERFCPRQIKGLYGVDADEDYPFCGRFRDSATGAARNLAFEPVCT